MSRWSPQNLGTDQRAPHGFLATLGKVAQIAAPIIGLAVGGPAGLAAGSAIGQGIGGAAKKDPISSGGTGGIPSSVPGASNFSAPGYQGMQSQIQGQGNIGASPLDQNDWRKQAAPFQYAGRQTPYSALRDTGQPSALGAKPSLWGGNPGARYVGMAEQSPSYLQDSSLLQNSELDPGALFGGGG